MANRTKTTARRTLTLPEDVSRHLEAVRDTVNVYENRQAGDRYDLTDVAAQLCRTAPFFMRSGTIIYPLRDGGESIGLTGWRRHVFNACGFVARKVAKIGPVIHAGK